VRPDRSRRSYMNMPVRPRTNRRPAAMLHRAIRLLLLPFAAALEGVALRVW
jgi:hypothetical protein